MTSQWVSPIEVGFYFSYFFSWIPEPMGNILAHFVPELLAEIENRKSLDLFGRDPNTNQRRDRFLLMVVVLANKHLAIEIGDPGCLVIWGERWPCR
ncbi:hypothetical protein AVEN_60903-1 [Araneus ventricosus]|uniref:Uncharacterized protein n=1 Tax=Araneus ventricosus TaxID=182803 RepID=A0A4Y2S9W3_ARAVE|nr:hypothetical protein AVEN_60903-1 [Araneus ventricosus]